MDEKIKKRKKYNILLAEDDYSIANLLKMSIELSGYKVYTAINGKIAFEQIRSIKPDLIVLDINMPELNGFEVIEEIKKVKHDLSKTKIMFLTNSSTTGDITKAKELGATYSIKAEVSPKQLISIMDSHLGI